MSESQDQIVYLKPDQMEEIKETKGLKPNNPNHGPSFSAIDELFEKLKLSEGAKSVLYNDHANSQEEGKRLFSSLIEIFQSTCAIDKDAKLEYIRDVVTFQYFDFKLEDYQIVDILGEGLHGLVIKMGSRNMNNIVIKLFKHRNERAFKEETTFLSNVQKARELSLHTNSFGQIETSKFNHRYFKTDKYFGLVIKAGLGSLLDFKNYLKKSKDDLKESKDHLEESKGPSKLSAQELFILTWALLDSCYCLHQIQYCHRDIKPANIIIDPDTFLPELIDYSLAADISKAKGSAGTPGYRMEDFEGMKKYIENETTTQLIANDYFALGKTMLEIAFPDYDIWTVINIKGQLEKLRKTKSFKIVADALEICLFGSVKDKQNILKEHSQKYLNPGYWDKTDELKWKEYNDVYDNFNPCEKDPQLKKFKENHFQKFKIYMEKQSLARKNQKDNISQNAQEFITFVHSKQQAKSEDEEIEIQSLEEEKYSDEEDKYLNDEEKYMIENFEKNPEKALEKCFEVIYQFANKDFLISDSKLCSVLMTVLYSHDFLDDAIALGKKYFRTFDKKYFRTFDKTHWIFINNLDFLYAQRILQLRTYKSSLYKYSRKNYNHHRYLFIDELIKGFESAACDWYIRQSYYTKERNYEDFTKEELILTSFKMGLINPESYPFMNYSYCLASFINQLINEKTKEKIKDFVYDVNISDRKDVLDLINCPGEIRVQLVLMSFCEILATIDCSEHIELESWKTEAQKIISQKKTLAEKFSKSKESLSEDLLNSSITYIIMGFIILYNLKYDLLTKFEAAKWVRSNEREQFENIEELNKHVNKLQAEQDKKWSKQKFLDKVLAFWSEITDGKFLVPIIFRREYECSFDSLSFFGRELSEIILFDPWIIGKTCLLEIDRENDLIFLLGVRMNFALFRPIEIGSFFADPANIQKLKRLRHLTIEFSHYSASDLFQSIIGNLTFLELKNIEIRLINKIFEVTNEDFNSLFRFIENQVQLTSVKIELDQSIISSEAVQVLAIALKNLKELQELNLSFKNCPKVENSSIVKLLEEIKELPQLEYVDLYFGACLLITSVEKPQDLHFDLNIGIDITVDHSSSVGISEHDDVNDYDYDYDFDYDDYD